MGFCRITMNDRKFTLTLGFEETLERNGEYPTFTLWKRLEVCNGFKDVEKTIKLFRDELIAFIVDKLEVEKE